MPATEPYYVEQIHVMAPKGFQAQVRAVARQEGQTLSEFIRSAVRDKLRAVAPEQASAGAD